MTIAYLFFGALSGIISGMGIGGGVVLIPALTLLLSMDQKTAQTINLIYFIPTAGAALISHIKNKRVEKDAVSLALFGLIGAAAGSFLVILIAPMFLKKLFGGFLLIIGTIEFFKKK